MLTIRWLFVEKRWFLMSKCCLDVHQALKYCFLLGDMIFSAKKPNLNCRYAHTVCGFFLKTEYFCWPIIDFCGLICWPKVEICWPDHKFVDWLLKFCFLLCIQAQTWIFRAPRFTVAVAFSCAFPNVFEAKKLMSKKHLFLLAEVWDLVCPTILLAQTVFNHLI